MKYKLKSIIIISIIILLTISSLIIFNSTKNEEIKINNSKIDNETNITEYTNSESTQNVIKNNGSLEIYFCPYNNCEKGLIDIINKSETIYCAFYDLDLTNLVKILENKYAIILLDDSQEENKDFFKNISDKITYIKGSELMHNKFCILDNNKIITGSMNPTNLGTNNNNNNFVIIESEFLVNRYNKEFENLFSKELNKEIELNKINQNKLNYNYFIFNEFLVENYFCPQECKGENSALTRILYLLDNAEESIDIAAFSFTQEDILEKIIDANERDVKIRIVMEKRFINTESSVFKILKAMNIDVIFDSNPNSMHHKFIIIDNKIIEFGSLNFSDNAFLRNNENILIIHNTEISSAFTEEFERLWLEFN